MKRRSRQNLFTALLIYLLLASFVPGVLAEDRPSEGESAHQVAAIDRAYAQRALEKRMPAASVQYFAEEGVAFVPHVTNGKRYWSSHQDFPGELIWTPIFAAAARAGDLAYTTGPWELKKTGKSIDFGNYVRVWRRREKGEWQIALDVGTDNAQPRQSPSPLQVSPAEAAIANVENARRNLLKTERRLIERARSIGAVAVLDAAADEVRVFRDEELPAVGLSAARLMLSSERGKLTRSYGGSEISNSGDLSYTYGTSSEEKGNNTQNGVYLTIWRINLNGDWQVVLDLQKKTGES